MIEPEKALAHIVFDCDGTLVSSHEGIIDALVVFLGQLLGKVVEKEEVRKNYYPQLNIMAERFGIDASSQEKQKELLDHWAVVCAKQPHQFSLFPQIKDLLNACEQNQWALYVWT